MNPLYDQIGLNYDITRKADPEIARRLYEHLQVFDVRPIVDIACGTGNYTIALQRLGLNVTGVDISLEMLKSAQGKSNSIDWVQSNVENLPFENDYFSGATCILAIHHFRDLKSSFEEIYRVIKRGSRLVIFTATAEQMNHYWLNVYFPNMMRNSIQQMPTEDQIKISLQDAGFTLLGFETFLVEPNLEDFFLYSGKFRPEMYLNEKVRSGISSFTSLADPAEINTGLHQLTQDLQTGEIMRKIKDYPSIKGDYMYVIVEK
ncbi:methyltransferase domain-containing protein [Paenibacillus sediminis]|uniref:Ubiquinone/menaquinone biosynthesis C-methylase UbiE n=1 Tax=Paenibacillus sediminis TaxID=664909 RepID=A0ABS4H1X0_9BACL|nr:methyltransferase domain-containing protein [Paenibacillus sediminis]MBP1936529.1 ubiquinone/menaquinone biosynthesis C-methylase UbiE [Paenibacillus sediminis]